MILGRSTTTEKEDSRSVALYVNFGQFDIYVVKQG